MKTKFFSCLFCILLIAATIHSQPVVLGDPNPQLPNPHFYWTKYPGAVYYKAQANNQTTFLWEQIISDTQVTINWTFSYLDTCQFRVKAYNSTDSTNWSAHYNFWFLFVNVHSISSEVPEQFSLSQNYPNPFNPSTKIKFSLPLPSKEGVWDVRLVIYNLLGKEIADLIPPLRGGQEGLSPGIYEAEWNASNFASGIYYYRLTARQVGSSTGDPSTGSGQSFSETKKMILLK
jgi:hypothetical protein